MALIDKDVLLQQIQGLYEPPSYPDYTDTRAFQMGALARKLQVIELITKAPEVEKRATGEWLELDVDYLIGSTEMQSAKCSVCGRYHTTPYRYYFSHYDYCPSCGAMMEKSE
jgi:hypothetical protein